MKVLRDRDTEAKSGEHFGDKHPHAPKIMAMDLESRIHIAMVPRSKEEHDFLNVLEWRWKEWCPNFEMDISLAPTTLLTTGPMRKLFIGSRIAMNPALPTWNFLA